MPQLPLSPQTQLAVNLPKQMATLMEIGKELSEMDDSTIVTHVFGGYAGGLALGSCTNLAGATVGLLVSSLTGISRKITTVAGIASTGAFLVNYFGNSPFSIGIKVGAACSTIWWSTKNGLNNHVPSVSIARRLELEDKALLCGHLITVGSTLIGNPVLGTFLAGICSNLLIKISSLYEEQHPAIA